MSEQQRDNVVRLELDGKTYILAGTAHVSQESVDEVRTLVREHMPERVCIELDQGRYNSLSDADAWRRLDIYKVVKDGKGPLLLSNLMLASYQKRLGIDLGTKPGEDMRAAIAAATELGIPFDLIDREIQVTLQRAWASTGFWGRVKLIGALLSASFGDEKIEAEQIENLKQTSALHGMLEELASYLPSIKKSLIDERDQYMATRLYQTIGTPLLAVVGAGHVPGMVQHLRSLHEGTSVPDLGGISVVPPSGILGKILGWALPALLVILMILGFVNGGLEKGLGGILNWILFNGGLAALGALLALGHPLTILTAFLGAPVATLNPFIGIGMFTGLVEAMVRKPRVHDLEQLTEDINSFHGFFRNRVTRVLLVFILSSIGGMIGNLIAVPLLFPV